MAIILPTKYRVKIALYKSKNFLRDAFMGGKSGMRKRARIFSVLAVFVVTGLILSVSVYGMNLRGNAGNGQTKISETTNNITNNYNYDYKGVSIHTKAENLAVGYENSATVQKGKGHRVKFTLTVSNADTVTKKTDVKFTFPNTFTYNGENGTDKIIYTGGISGCTVNPSPLVIGSTNPISWTNCNAPAGDSTIVFEALAP